MMNNVGEFQMLPPDFNEADVERAKRDLDDLHALLVRGTEDEIKQMATKVRLGHAEIERRQKRRAQQKASRRRNR